MTIAEQIPANEVEDRLLRFCRTARVLPGDDLRARSTWPAVFVDIARRIDEELRWVEREPETRRYIPTARDLDDVLTAGAWFAALGDVRERGTEAITEAITVFSRDKNTGSPDPASATARRALRAPAQARRDSGGTAVSANRKPWSFSLEQKLIWWASLEPCPSWRTMAVWHGRISHTTARNRYLSAIRHACLFANDPGLLPGAGRARNNSG